MNKKGKVLTWSAVVIIAVGFFTGAVLDYIKDRAISVNPAVTKAKIVDTQTQTKRKKGVTRTSYDFTYEFEVDGKKYRGQFGTSQNNATPYLKKGIVRITYNKDNPDINDLSKKVDLNKNFMSLVWAFVKSVLFGLLLGFLIGAVVSHKLGWIKSDNESKESETPNPTEA